MAKLTKSNKKAKKQVDTKKSFDLNEFFQSFQSLDTNNYGSWPVPVKITVLLMIVFVVAIVAYFVPINQKREEIRTAEAEKASLLDQYKTKESKARHLAEYQAQVHKMETDFQELLNQLPKDTRISDLVDGINMEGMNSNIRFKDISVEAEIQQEFFIEQPIRIVAIGEYHQFGSFVSGLAKLPRIVTLHNFEINNTKPTLDQLPELELLLNVKTYRSKELSGDDLKKAQNVGEQKEAK